MTDAHGSHLRARRHWECRAHGGGVPLICRGCIPVPAGGSTSSSGNVTRSRIRAGWTRRCPYLDVSKSGRINGIRTTWITAPVVEPSPAVRQGASAASTWSSRAERPTAGRLPSRKNRLPQPPRCVCTGPSHRRSSSPAVARKVGRCRNTPPTDSQGRSRLWAWHPFPSRPGRHSSMSATDCAVTTPVVFMGQFKGFCCHFSFLASCTTPPATVNRLKIPDDLRYYLTF
jgi:hypothetical protein